MYYVIRLKKPIEYDTSGHMYYIICSDQFQMLKDMSFLDRFSMDICVPIL